MFDAGKLKALTRQENEYRFVDEALELMPMPEAVEYSGAAEHLQEVWIAVRANLRAVLESVTLADLVEGELPPSITELTRDPEAWRHH